MSVRDAALSLKFGTRMKRWWLSMRSMNDRYWKASPSSVSVYVTGSKASWVPRTVLGFFLSPVIRTSDSSSNVRRPRTKLFRSSSSGRISLMTSSLSRRTITSRSRVAVPVRSCRDEVISDRMATASSRARPRSA